MNAVSLADLLPAEQLQQNIAEVAVADLNSNGIQPERTLVESVKALGVLEPILVAVDGAGRAAWVLDGLRRVAAAKAAGIPTVRAVLVSTATPLNQALTLTLNAVRHPNPVAEYRAIKALVALGYSHQQISQGTGMPRGAIRRRLRLDGLDPYIMQALEEGRTTQGVAEDAAHSSVAVQQRVIEALAKGEKVTRADVRRWRHVAAASASAAVDLSGLFSPAASLAPTNPYEVALEHKMDAVSLALKSALQAGDRDAVRIGAKVYAALRQVQRLARAS